MPQGRASLTYIIVIWNEMEFKPSLTLFALGANEQNNYVLLHMGTKVTNW